MITNFLNVFIRFMTFPLVLVHERAEIFRIIINHWQLTLTTTKYFSHHENNLPAAEPLRPPGNSQCLSIVTQALGDWMIWDYSKKINYLCFMWTLTRALVEYDPKSIFTPPTSLVIGIFIIGSSLLLEWKFPRLIWCLTRIRRASSCSI